MDVGDWLRNLGLGQYEAVFRENDIDAEVLPELTEADFEKIGVSLGHRKRLFKAIAALDASRAQSTPPSTAPIPSSIPLPSPQPATASAQSAERRHLAVMFCDLVGSTSISAKLDAEDWRDLVGSYLDAASTAVTQMGGHVAKKLGDGIMALFGYPIGQENDSERAVRACLAIQRALAEHNVGNRASGRPELVARIGVETGAVVVDSTGEVFGDAPNVAARVQALAEPGTIFVTAKVQRQVAGLFVAEDRGSHALKGVPEPMHLYRIVRASGGGRRSGQRSLTPLVGRDEELSMLMRRWERARAGDGQFLQIVAEPGLGKSRLIKEFQARLVDTPHTWVEWSSSQLLQNTPLHPVADWGRQRFGGADMPADRRLAELEATLQHNKLDPAEYAPLLAPLVEIPLPPERAANITPEELRRRQMAALLAWVMAGARVQPTLLAFEDLHWADPTTLDLMRGFAERGALAPLFVLATARPEFRASWGARSHHGTITLTPLDRRQVASMVAELAAKHALSSDIVEGVSERTGGVPLFVEEVTRLLLESGALGGTHAIPPTLQQSLTARLDRLGPAREVAMIGAVLGRDFSYPMLRDLAGMDDAPLQQALEKLAEADILLVEGLPPDAEYRFKHALIQDAAYENLLKSRRQALHRRAAEALRDQHPERAATQPEALAHHFTEGGLTETAIEWWSKAGDQALRRSALPEAIAHLGKAIEMADKGGRQAANVSANSPTPEMLGITDGRSLIAALPASETVETAAERRRRRLELQVAYGNALVSARGYVAPETVRAFERARELAVGGGDSVARLSMLYGAWLGVLVNEGARPALKMARAMLAETGDAETSIEAGIAHRLTGASLGYIGDYVAGTSHLQKAVAMLETARLDGLISRFNDDPFIGALIRSAFDAWICGEPEQSRALAERAVAEAHLHGHASTLSYVHGWKAMLEAARRDPERAKSDADAALSVAAETGVRIWVPTTKLIRLWALHELEGGAFGAESLREGLPALREVGHHVMCGPMLTALAAEAEARAGSPDEALMLVCEALADNARSGFNFLDADLRRVAGEIQAYRQQPNSTAAEEQFKHAIALARTQGARGFELRAALNLAKLYQSTGRAAEAHDVLGPALQGFSPTPEFREIAEAQALFSESSVAAQSRKADKGDDFQ